MNMRVGIFVGLSLLLAVGAAGAADVSAQVKARQDYFHSVGRAMKGLNEELKKSNPSKADVQNFAATLDTQAPKLMTYFPVGSGTESGVKTGAKPEVWTKSAEFKTDATSFATAAHKLNLTAQTGDPAALKAAFSELGATCKACHQTFRTKDD